MACTTFDEAVIEFAKQAGISKEDARMLITQQEQIIINDGKIKTAKNNILLNNIDFSRIKGIDKVINIWSTDHNGYSYLSNVFVGPINIKGTIFKTIEHMYQYSKASYFKDKVSMEAILNAETGKDAKKLGNQIKNFNAEKWNNVSSDKLYKAMKAGFRSDKYAYDLLMSTGNAYFTHKYENKSNYWEYKYPALLTQLRSEFKNNASFKEIPFEQNIILPGSFEDITLHSGAAQGGDNLFKIIMKNAGIGQQKHYLSSATKDKWSKTNKAIYEEGLVVDKNAKELEEGHKEAEKAIIFLGRKKYFPNDLTARNWFQIKDSTQVVAITRIIEPGELVTIMKDGRKFYNETNHRIPSGGTGYAVAMGINKKIDINVFDYKQNKWFSYDYAKKDFVESKSPILSTNFAGIGSREIEKYPGQFDQNAINAINEVVQNTKNYIANSKSESKKYYIGRIETLAENEIFVFGTNALGFHGAGAAAFASFGDSSIKHKDMNYSKQPNGYGKYNNKGTAKGLMTGTDGQSYGLQTVSTFNNNTKKFNPLSKEEIINNIKDLYDFAYKAENQNKRMIIAFGESLDFKNLNGYTTKEMADMFIEAGVIPNNIIFSQVMYDYINNKTSENKSVSMQTIQLNENRHIDIVPNFYDENKVSDITIKLEKEFNTIEPEEIKSNKIGHKSIAYGAEDYSYSSRKSIVIHKAKEIPDFLKSILIDAAKINKLDKNYYNQVLINKFDDGVGIGKHDDAELLYIDNNFEVGRVAVYSIGNTVGPHWFGNIKQYVPSNSFAVMSSGDIPHSVANASGVRYSITLRHIPINKAIVSDALRKAKKITNIKQKKLNFAPLDMANQPNKIYVQRITKAQGTNENGVKQFKIAGSKSKMNIRNNFGNPFIVTLKKTDKNQLWEKEIGNSLKVSEEYYKWLTIDDYIPNGYNGTNQELSQLKLKKKWILDNLDLIDNATDLIYWKNPDDDYTHVDALVAVVEYYKNKKQKKLQNKQNNENDLMNDVIMSHFIPKKLNNFINNELSEPQKEAGRKYFKENIGKKTYQDLYNYLVSRFKNMDPVKKTVKIPTKFMFDDDAYILQNKFMASPDQKYLIDEAVKMFINDSKDLKDNILFLHGMGGTGKSTTIGRAIELAQKKLDGFIMFAGMTFTHSAKGVLRSMSSTMDKEKIKIRIETTSSFLSLMNNDSQWIIDEKSKLPVVDNFKNPQKRKTEYKHIEQQTMSLYNDIVSNKQMDKVIIVVDESSMIDYKEMSQLIALSQVYPGKIKIVLMGDYHQLPPVSSISNIAKNNQEHIFNSFVNNEIPISPSMASYLGYNTFNNDSDLMKNINDQLKEAKNIQLITQNRQSTNSDLYKVILNAATRIERELIRAGSNTYVYNEIQNISKNSDTVTIIKDDENKLYDLYKKLFKDKNPSESRYITFNNKNVVIANNEIRKAIFSEYININGDLPSIIAGKEYLSLYDNHAQPQPELTNGLNLKIIKTEEVPNVDGYYLGEKEFGFNSNIFFIATYKPGVKLIKITMEYTKLESDGTEKLTSNSLVIPANILDEVKRESLHPGSVIKRTGKNKGKHFASVREIYMELIRRDVQFEKRYPGGAVYDIESYKVPDEALLAFKEFLPMYYSYAISTYKSQGQSIDNVIYNPTYKYGIKDNKNISKQDKYNIRKLSNEYTALSRVKKHLYIVNPTAYMNEDFNQNIQGSDDINNSFYDKNKGDILYEEEEIDFKRPGSVLDMFKYFFYQDASKETDEEQSLNFYSMEYRDMQETIAGYMDQAFANGATSKITYQEVEVALRGENDRATTGSIEHRMDGSAKINLRWNKYNGTARKSEIFMHEMVHFMTQRAFALSPEVQIVIKELQKVVREAGLTYEIFLVDLYNQGIEPTEIDIQIAKDKWEYTISDIADPEEFFAYAATNEHLFNAISGIKIKPEIIELIDNSGSKGIVKSVKNLINAIIKMINSIWAGQAQASGKDGATIIIDTMKKLVELQAKLDTENAIARELDANDKAEDDNILKDMDEKLSPWIIKFDDAIENLHKKTKNNSSIKQIVENLKKISLLGRFIESNLIQYIYTSVTKKTNDEKWAHLYRLYRIGKNFTEKYRKGLSDSIGRIIEPYFKDIDNGTRNAISRIIFKIDMPSLLDSKNNIDFDELKIILDDEDKLQQIIQAAENDMLEKYEKAYSDKNNAKNHFDDDILQANGLANYLNSGEVIQPNQQLNASNIFNKFYKSGSSVTSTQTFTKDVFKKNTKEELKAITALDKYITYKALQMSPAQDRKLVKHYLKTSQNIKNIKSMLNMYTEFINNAVDDLRVTTYNPVPKGYFESLNKTQMKFEIIAEDEVTYYEGMFGNMENIGEYGTINGVKYYKLVGRGHDVGFDEGMISIAGTTIEGISLKNILINDLQAINKKKKKKERVPKHIIESSATELLDRFIKSGGNDKNIFNGAKGNMPIPVYDFTGSIIDYKIQPNIIDKVKHMGYNLDVVESAKYTFSKIQHRQASVQHNKEVVDTLFDFHEKYAIEDADNFITLKKQEDGEVFNEDIHGRWNRIPEYTRNYIFAKTGKHAITIPKDMLETITGERQVTFSNFNIGPIDLRNHPRIQKMILAIEDYIAEILLWLKETIAIRMGNVVGANTLSNMIQAWIHGKIDPIEYIKRARRKWQELNDYREMLDELNDEKVKLVAQGSKQEKKTLNRIKILETRINKNPFHILVEDGQFSPIIEDVNIDEDIARGHIAQAIEDGFNKNEFTRKINPIKEVLFLDRNTKIYKTMMKFTQYGDIITREILREKKEEDAIKRGKPLSDKEKQAYLDFLDQLFVNYSYIDNRFVKYSERIMGVFFTKYFLRQAKAMQTVIAQNPARFGALISGEALTGYDLETAEDQYYHPLTSFLNKLGFMHPDRVFDSLTDIPLFGVIPDMNAFAQKIH